MTQPEKAELLMVCHLKLKRASHYASSLTGQPVTPELVSTLMTLTAEAHAAVANLRSLVSKIEPPNLG